MKISIISMAFICIVVTAIFCVVVSSNEFIPKIAHGLEQPAPLEFIKVTGVLYVSGEPRPYIVEDNNLYYLIFRDESLKMTAQHYKSYTIIGDLSRRGTENFIYVDEMN